MVIIYKVPVTEKAYAEPTLGSLASLPCFAANHTHVHQMFSIASTIIMIVADGSVFRICVTSVCVCVCVRVRVRVRVC